MPKRRKRGQEQIAKQNSRSDGDLWIFFSRDVLDRDHMHLQHRRNQRGAQIKGARWIGGQRRGKTGTDRRNNRVECIRKERERAGRRERQRQEGRAKRRGGISNLGFFILWLLMSGTGVTIGGGLSEHFAG